MTKVNDKVKNELIEKRRNEEKTGNRIDELITTVENHTRTERHLEQYSEIGDPKGKAHARDIQLAREAEIQHLKNTIIYGENYDDHQLENLKEKIEDTQEYLEHNSENMDSQTLQNIQEKQKNREEAYDQLRFK